MYAAEGRRLFRARLFNRGAICMTNANSDFTLKPWGGETVLAQTTAYVVKILHLNAGCRTSLQYHRVKRETMIPGSGSAILELHVNGVVETLDLTQPFEVLPGTVHRLVAMEDSEIVEVSSLELDDVVRLEDDYGRAELPALSS
jgi:mannose-6-phosphate isomerase